MFTNQNSWEPKDTKTCIEPYIPALIIYIGLTLTQFAFLLIYRDLWLPEKSSPTVADPRHHLANRNNDHPHQKRTLKTISL